MRSRILISQFLGAAAATALAVTSFAFQKQSPIPAPDQRATAAAIAAEAQAALRRGDYPAAIQGFEQLVKMSPAVAEFHSNLGMAYYSTNQFTAASEQFEQALKLKPGLANAHYFLGLSLAKGDRCREAVPYLGKDYERVNDPQLRRELGTQAVRCSMALEQPDKAVDFLRLLNRDFRDDPEMLYLSSHVYSDLSTAASERLLFTAPGSYQAHELNAEVLEMSGKLDDAAREYRKILEANPGLPGIHYRLGRVLLASAQGPGALEDARREFEDELKVNPSDAPSEYELGEMARKARQWNDAIQHFSRAATLDPELTDALIGLGKALLSAGRSAEAVEPLQKALRLEPENAVAHYQLGLAYRRLGRVQEADNENALYEKLHQKHLSTMDAIAGGITGKVSQQQTAEPPD